MHRLFSVGVPRALRWPRDTRQSRSTDELTLAACVGPWQTSTRTSSHRPGVSQRSAAMAVRSLLGLFALLAAAAPPSAESLYGPPPCSGNERPFSGIGLNASACGFYPCSSVGDCPPPPSGVTARPTCTSSYCVLACGELVGGDCASSATCFDLGGLGVGVCLFPDADIGSAQAPGKQRPAQLVTQQQSVELQKQLLANDVQQRTED